MKIKTKWYPIIGLTTALLCTASFPALGLFEALFDDDAVLQTRGGVTLTSRQVVKAAYSMMGESNDGTILPAAMDNAAAAQQTAILTSISATAASLRATASPYLYFFVSTSDGSYNPFLIVTANGQGTLANGVLTITGNYYDGFTAPSCGSSYCGGSVYSTTRNPASGPSGSSGSSGSIGTGTGTLTEISEQKPSPSPISPIVVLNQVVFTAQAVLNANGNNSIDEAVGDGNNTTTIQKLTTVPTNLQALTTATVSAPNGQNATQAVQLFAKYATATAATNAANNLPANTCLPGGHC
jgi:hypothetical protein